MFDEKKQDQATPHEDRTQDERRKSPAVTTLGRLLAHMVLDPDYHEAFLDDPESVIADAGLSPEEAEALRCGDWEQIKELLGTGKKPMHVDPPPDTDGGG